MRFLLGFWLFMVAWSMNRYFEDGDLLGIDAPELHLLMAANYCALAVHAMGRIAAR